MLFDIAQTFCETITFGRLPSKDELISIVDSAIRYQVFTSTKASSYWSSTTYASNPYYAWFVNFDGVIVYAYNKNHTFYVRCVRGGQ